MYFRYFLGLCAVIISMLTSLPLAAQTTDSVVRRLPPSAYEGRHFFVGFLQNEDYILQGGLHLQIFIASSRPARVGLTPPGSRIVNYFNLQKDTIITLEVAQQDLGNYESIESELIRYKLAEIVADQPVTVYAMSSQAQSSDAYSVLPVTEWDRDYVALSMPNDNYTDDPNESEELLDIRQSELLIMAAYDNTFIVVSPSTKTERGVRRGESVNITLNKGQCYLIKSNKFLLPGDGDLSGTLIKADKPIGVLAGHVRSSVPAMQYNRGEDNSKDHLCDMLLPVQKWDSEYVSIPFDILSAQGDFFKVTAAFPNTEIMYSGPGISGRFSLANPGDTASLDGINIPLVWTANKKFSIAQFMETSFNRGEVFDPAMVILPPRNRYVSRALFQVLPNPEYNPQKFRYHYAGLVVDATALNNITLDGYKVTDLNKNILSQLIPTRNLYWVNLNLPPGKHELRAEKGKFSGTIYGVGMNDSYAMTLGIAFDNPDSDTIPPIVAYNTYCGVLTGEATDKLSPEMTGIFSATVLQNSNFNFTVSPIADTSRFLTFTAKPIDPTIDGYIVIDFRDKAGNGRIVRHTYNAIRINVEKSVSFGSVHWRDTMCKSITIHNIGTAAVRLSGISLFGDKRLKFFPDISAYLKDSSLSAGDSITLNFCFYPSGDSTALSSTCRLNLPCNLTLDIPISGSVIAPGIMANGWNFGKVLIGDTACARVKILNTGNIPMIITSLLLPDSTIFFFKSKGLLPDTLAPHDSLIIPVCFAPKDRIEYTEGGFAIDQFNGQIGFTVTGRGIAPLILPAAINWGKRRAGSANDSLFWLKNIGNTSATISYGAVSGDVSAFVTTGSGIKNFEIQENDSVQVSASFIPPPDGVRSFSATEHYSVTNWRLHPKVDATLAGEGTLPVLSAFDTDFGTVQVNRTHDSTTVCIRSDGNEALTIDSIYIAGGDATSFIISSAELRKKRVVSPGDSIVIPATFTPTTIGYKEIILAAVHDAAPNFQRRTSQFRFYGNASPDDTLQGDMQLKMNAGTMPACLRQPIVMTVKNTGNRTLTIDSLYVISPQQADLAIVSTPQLPYSLPRDEEISASFFAVPKGNLPLELTFRATASAAGIFLEEKREIIPVMHNTSAELHFNSSSLLPGQNGDMTINGTIETSDTVQIHPSITLTLPSKMALISTNTANCTLTEGRESRITPVAVVQSQNEIQISFSAPLVLSQSAKWEITLPYQLMLSELMKAESELTFYDKLGGCFNNAKAYAAFDISPVCAQIIRTVKAMTGVYMLLGTSPQPADASIDLRYLSPEPMLVDFTAVNTLGTSIPLGKYLLPSTAGEISLDVSLLPVGAYRLIGESKKYGIRDAKMLIISR